VSVSQSTVEQLLYATVRVETEIPAGSAVGTGFFAGLTLDHGRTCVVLVSSRHVLAGATCITFWMTLADDHGRPMQRFVKASISSDGSGAFLHPDPSTDLAAVVVHHVVNRLEASGTRVFYRNVPETMIPTSEIWNSFDAGEDIIMTGCPGGIHDEVNKLPLVRRGVVASYLPLDYNGRPEFLVDLVASEGSSGSPIFLMSFLTFNRRLGAYEPAPRSYLLGILKSGLEIQEEPPVDGSTDEVQPSHALHLGVAIKSTELHALYGLVRKFAAADG
jgi:hypothetical protein